MKPIGTKTIRTERLTLREIIPTDAVDLFSAGVLGESLEEAVGIVENMIKYNADPNNFHWTIEYEGHAVGRIKAWEVNCADNYAQLGYDIGESCRCLGLMTEAVCAVSGYLLRKADFNRIYCMVRTNNPASIRVCEKAGMVREGIMRRHFSNPDGGYDDVMVMGLLKSDLHG